MTVSTRKISRDHGPRLRPNAAPGLNTSVRRTTSPSTFCGTRCPGSKSTAAIFVITSIATTPATNVQKSPGLGLLWLLLLGIFLSLLARKAEPGVGKCIQPVEIDVLTAIVTLPERLRRPVQPAQRFVDVPQEPALLAREEECLLAFHRVRSLVRHVEGVRAQVAVRRLRRGVERLAVVAELLEHPLPLFEQPLLEVREQLLCHRLVLLRAR